MPDLADLFPGLASRWIDTRAGRIFARTGGEGPPLLFKFEQRIRAEPVMPTKRPKAYSYIRMSSLVQLQGDSLRR